MIQPSKKYQDEVKALQRERLIDTFVMTYGTIAGTRKIIVEKIPELMASPTITTLKLALRKLETEIVFQYNMMFANVVDSVVGEFNASVLEQRYLTEQTIGKINWNKVKVYKQIPQTKQFKITNRYLNKSSIIKRNTKNATRVSKIIEKGYRKGYPIHKVNKQIEIELGYRRRDGKLSKKGLKLMKQGRYSHRNGHLAQVNRIASNEMKRMSDFQANNNYIELRNKGVKVRLQMIASLIRTSRVQSARMNNQLDGEPIGGGKFNPRQAGKFMYPDGGWYVFGTHPVQWFVNDREIIVNVFDEPKVSPSYSSFKDFT